MATMFDQDPQLAELFGLVKDELAHSHTSLGAVGDLSALSRRIVNIIERSDQSNELADIVGPFYDTAGLVTWLGYTKQAIEKRRKAHKLLGCRTTDGKWLYPVWQFQEDGEPLPGLPEALRLLSEGLDDGWTIALWFTGETPERLDGASPRDWLRQGGEPQAVLDIARIDSAAWAA